MMNIFQPQQQNPQQMVQQQVVQQQQQQQQQPQQPPLDNISKIKSLIGPLRESLSVYLTRDSVLAYCFIIFFRIQLKQLLRLSIKTAKLMQGLSK